ncbi:hypothetical protein KIN20_020118 [Parelaphostrongylus tenuis]|uniref:Uncharacterized protein n=1 Tax=Parelaphostrongylus tenuis TaxID=148309 RepID=A0AAD5MM42_PARTN|nr:hypothetical protein KIN20_020118 [Parelaphostrongylus tenuis]
MHGHGRPTCISASDEDKALLNGNNLGIVFPLFQEKFPFGDMSVLGGVSYEERFKTNRGWIRDFQCTLLGKHPHLPELTDQGLF